MDKLQEIFITEASELIANLERTLLGFETELESEKCVQEIFRVMHTLKGSASMFGFEAMSVVTHDLETIYDSIREGKSKATHEILEITLQAVDHLKNLMRDPKLQNAENKARHEEILTALKQIVSSDPTVTTSDEVSTENQKATYYISFNPASTIFNNGTNPLYLVDDLAALGNTIVIPNLNLIPSLQVLNENECYVSFEIILSTASSPEEIKSVFLFVEDLCTLTITKLSNENLCSDQRFVTMVHQRTASVRGALGYETVKTLAEASNVSTPEAKIASTTSAKTEATSIRVSSEKLDELMNLVSELVTSQARLSLLSELHGISELRNLSENMDKITRRLRDNAFTICLVPIETLVVRFQRLVRDLSKELKKEVEFSAEGTETELDRSIIENVTEPILHILRNSLDHGIETPAERVKNGKKSQGKIHLKAYHSGTSVYIQIKDDGNGINPEKIRQKALAKGLINEDDKLTEKEVLDLIFAPGFSTAEKITDVSGRGVGMDIVKRKIEGIHGEVTLDSKIGEGTTLTIKLPLTLSIIDGMLVQIGDSKYILPLDAIDKCFEIPSKKITSHISQKHIFDGDLLPVFNLHEVFHEPANALGIMQVIKMRSDEVTVGFTVDTVIGEYQAVMKPLGTMYTDRDEFSGATILGDGSVALVIDTEKLIKQLTAKELQYINN